MGVIWTKIWGKPSTKNVLEKISKRLKSIEEFKLNTQVWHKKIIGYLLLYFSSLYFLAAVIVYFYFYYDPDWQDVKSQLKLFIPFLVAPLILWVVKRVLTWWYHRKISKNEDLLVELRAQKTKILEEVMEKETYKVAKEILDKYGSSEQQIKSKTPVKPQESGVRRRQTTTVPATPTPAPAVNTSIRHTQSFKATPSVADRSVLNDRSLMAKDSPLRPAPQAMQRRPPGPPMPRPVLPRERGFMDKFVEYLVGDGPSNRYALICKQCQSHNGMALREEFEFVSFRCCYCYYWNPARKQRPTAPKLQEATAAKQESGSESTDEDEAVKTSDEKPSKEENEKSEVIRRPITPVENVTTDEEDLAKETEPVAEKSIEEKKED